MGSRALQILPSIKAYVSSLILASLWPAAAPHSPSTPCFSFPPPALPPDTRFIILCLVPFPIHFLVHFVRVLYFYYLLNISTPYVAMPSVLPSFSPCHSTFKPNHAYHCFFILFFHPRYPVCVLSPSPFLYLPPVHPRSPPPSIPLAHPPWHLLRDWGAPVSLCLVNITITYGAPRCPTASRSRRASSLIKAPYLFAVILVFTTPSPAGPRRRPFDGGPASVAPVQCLS